jgi:thymidylate synthase (FAD)
MSPSVKLIWITPHAEDQMVYCARVSNPKSQEEGKSPDKLIRYLAKHKHWSPFEMASMCVEINTTRDIAAQILRHRSFSFQEFSQRYSATDALGRALVPELRLQDNANKQNSLEDDFGVLSEKFHDRIDELFLASHQLYEDMLKAGAAKECARKVLPLQTPTRMYMSGTIRSWIHYLQVRGGVETQLEHRQIAEAIKGILKEHLPVIHETLLCPPTKPEFELPLPLSRPERLSPFVRLGRIIGLKPNVS